MTYEDAKELFEDIEVQVPIGCSRDFQVAREKAIEAMEKQIPKKPIDLITDENEFICIICPSCQEIAVEITDKYCRKCGQAIDWSE